MSNVRSAPSAARRTARICRQREQGTAPEGLCWEPRGRNWKSVGGSLMRALAIAFVSASLLALPAAAQQQNQGNGLGNVLRNLNQAISPNGDQNGRGQQQNYGDNE